MASSMKPVRIPSAGGPYGTKQNPITVRKVAVLRNKALAASSAMRPDLPTYEGTQIVTLNAAMADHSSVVGPAFNAGDDHTLLQTGLRFTRNLTDENEAMPVADGSQVYNVVVAPMIDKKTKEQVFGTREESPLFEMPLYRVVSFDVIVVEADFDADWDDDDATPLDSASDEDEEEDDEEEVPVAPVRRKAKA